MAIVVDDSQLTEKRKSGIEAKYPWNEWLDGRTWRATRGVDFDVSLDAFRSVLYGKASRTSRWKIRSEIDGDSVVFRASPRA